MKKFTELSKKILEDVELDIIDAEETSFIFNSDFLGSKLKFEFTDFNNGTIFEIEDLKNKQNKFSFYKKGEFSKNKELLNEIKNIFEKTEKEILILLEKNEFKKD